QTLDLSDNEIESMQGFHRSNSITWLSLAGNKLKDTAGLDSMKRLYILLLERNFISSMDGLFNLPKLQTLFMQKNKLVKVGDLSNFHSLQHTNFSDNKIPEPPKKPAPDTTVPKKSPTGASAAETAAEQDPNMVPGHVASSNPPETTTLPKCKKTIADSYHYKKHSQGFSNTFEASRTKIKIDRTSGVRMLPNAFNGNFAFLVCTVKSGRVRVYLKAPNIFRFKKDKYGQKKMDSQRSKNFVYGVAEPGSPCKIRGGLMCMPDSVHQVILEPLEGPASGITVKISSKEINTRRP
ncbi:MAG: leucine-rich repeat domain-containing protein, partial [bacterium]|nr:leucine-rich repeat domain-containing protein [bacterium]